MDSCGIAKNMTPWEDTTSPYMVGLVFGLAFIHVVFLESEKPSPSDDTIFFIGGDQEVTMARPFPNGWLRWHCFYNMF